MGPGRIPLTVVTASSNPGINPIKLFTAVNLRIFVISYSVCALQAFAALSNVCE